MLVLLDGSEDSKVNTEGMSEYRPPVAPNIDEDGILVAEKNRMSPASVRLKIKKTVTLNLRFTQPSGPH